MQYKHSTTNAIQALANAVQALTNAVQALTNAVQAQPLVLDFLIKALFTIYGMICSPKCCCTWHVPDSQ